MEWVVLCVGSAFFIGCAIMVYVSGHALSEAVRQISKARSEDFQQVVSERRWQAQNSIEARMVETLTTTVNVQSDTIRDISDKLLAFTSDGREHMRNMQEIKAMQTQLEELRFLNAGLVAKAQGTSDTVTREPTVRREDNRVVANFDDQDV